MPDADASTAAARAALDRYELGDYALVALAESFNTMFRIELASTFLVLRVGPRRRVHPVGATRAEGRWTRELASSGLRVPQLVLVADGAASVVVEGRECSVWTWVPGEPMTRPPTRVDVQQLAALSARLHDATSPVANQPPGVLTARSVHYFDVPDLLSELRSPNRDVLVAARERAQEAIDRLWRTAHGPPRVVHGDLTPSNVVRHDGDLFAIDCQDLSWAHVEQDLAHSIYGVTRGDDLAAGLAAFRDGYERIRPWPRLDLDLLGDLVAARRVSMVNLAVLRGRPDLDTYVAGHAEALRAFVQ